VPTPDLKVTALTSTPEHVIVGRDGFTVTYTVTNQGPGVVPDRQNKWTDRVYLSRDRYLDAVSDHYLARSSTPAPRRRASYEVSRTYATPRGLVGPYYVIVLTDVPERTDFTFYDEVFAALGMVNQVDLRGKVIEGSSE